jgi:acyl carrier protein
MSREEILQKIEEVTVATYFKEDIQEDDNLGDTWGLDSLDKVEFFMELETKFNISIPEEDSEYLLTIKEVIDYLETKL